MYRYLYIAAVLLASLNGYGQNKEAIKFGKHVNKDAAYKHLSVLASDAYEGRETGTEGGWMAAEYIRNHFKAIGLKGPVNGDYFQPVDMASFSLNQQLLIAGQAAMPITDFYNMPQAVSIKGYNLSSQDVLFAGYGLNTEGYNDYKDQTIAGKIVLILKSGRPDGQRTDNNARAVSAALNTKLRYLAENGAAAVLVIDPAVDVMPDNLKAYLSEDQMVMKSEENVARLNQPQSMPVVTITTATANRILKSAGTDLEAVKARIRTSGKPATQVIKTQINISASKSEKKVRAENVLGYLEGSDPKLKDEVLVITAHYDHIGITPGVKGDDKINNGADDDGSGTTGVLLIADAFMKAKKAGKGPKRSILFMTVTGEEKGLLGSEWYSDHPIFPLANTVTNLNIDMIGRGDADHAGDNNFVYIIGSDMLSTELDRIGKKANKDYVNINLDERYNNRTDPNRFYYRSDHYNFAKHGIPVIFYFNGVHDDYHQPGDEVSKIDFPMLAKRAQLVYFTAWELANGAKRPAVDKNEDGTPKQ
ncbi:M28 family peptidase [Pedobacter deserti]|uniref:M28 family peptidase n=1 Tax=Pedobacter deserti TaxID=2817382 RepID=UPI002108F4C3|nr:M28 family peptidase [Pedobacter sp. SYSU D00382]